MNRITVFYDHIRNACRQSGIPFKEMAEKLTSAGISGVEIEYTELVGSTGAALAAETADAGLPISGVYCQFHWEDHSASVDPEEVLKRLKQLGIHTLLAIPGFIRPGQTAEQSREELSGPLKKLCLMAPSYDVSVIMEDFDAAIASFGDSAGVRWYLDNIPGLGCAFDTGNFLFFGEDSLEILPRFIDRIAYVHCKDRSLTPKCEETPLRTLQGLELYSSPVGSGIIHMTEILHTILDTGYTGPLAIEHFGAADQLSSMLQSAAYLNSILEEYSRA